MNATSSVMPPKDKLSILLGMYFGNYISNSLKQGDLQVDTNSMMATMQDVLSGKPAKLNETEYNQLFSQLRSAIMARRAIKSEEDKAKNDAYLANFAQAPGVIKLPSGVEYQVTKEGTGTMPKENDTVTVAYRGTLTDGTEFDKNDDFSTAVKGRVIQGWQNILPLMKVGSKFHVVIPPSMGYGPRGYPPKIPANAVLVFDMEMKSIKPGLPTAPLPQPIKPGASLPPTPPTPNSPVVSGEIIKVPSAEELKHGAKIEVIKANQTNASASTQ